MYGCNLDQTAISEYFTMSHSFFTVCVRESGYRYYRKTETCQSLHRAGSLFLKQKGASYIFISSFSLYPEHTIRHMLCDKLTFSFHLKRIKEGSKSSNRTSAVQMKLLQTNLLTQEGSVLVLFIYVIKGHLNAATYHKKQWYFNIALSTLRQQLIEDPLLFQYPLVQIKEFSVELSLSQSSAVTFLLCI